MSNETRRYRAGLYCVPIAFTFYAAFGFAAVATGAGWDFHTTLPTAWLAITFGTLALGAAAQITGWLLRGRRPPIG